jgi:hypothetical protein
MAKHTGALPTLLTKHRKSLDAISKFEKKISAMKEKLMKRQSALAAWRGKKAETAL